MKRIGWVFLFLFGLMNVILWAQPKSFGEKTAGMKKFEGFYTFYWDAKAGNIWLEIDRFDFEFLYGIILYSDIYLSKLNGAKVNNFVIRNTGSISLWGIPILFSAPEY